MARRPAGRPHLLILGALLGAVLACDDESLDAERAIDLVAPHVGHFDTFDRWARRAIQADPAFRSRESLHEVLFAPLRREPDVAGACVRRADDPRPLVHGQGRADTTEEAWIRVRHPALGPIEVARVPAEPSENSGSLLLVRRHRPGPTGERVWVTVAYRTSDG